MFSPLLNGWVGWGGFGVGVGWGGVTWGGGMGRLWMQILTMGAEWAESSYIYKDRDYNIRKQ